jgi:hypothetical protein
MGRWFVIGGTGILWWAGHESCSWVFVVWLWDGWGFGCGPCRSGLPLPARRSSSYGMG